MMRRVLLAGMIGLGLVVVGTTVDWKRVSVDELQGTLNDQVGYISVARQIAERRTFESSIVYPAVLRQNASRNTLYMPGYYIVLAATFVVMHYSVVASFLPSIAGYLLSCLLTYWIAWRIYGAATAEIACALFAFFPLGLVFAFSAMAEMAVVASGLVGFGLFLRWNEIGGRDWVEAGRSFEKTVALQQIPALRKGTEEWDAQKRSEIDGTGNRGINHPNIRSGHEVSAATGSEVGVGGLTGFVDQGRPSGIGTVSWKKIWVPAVAVVLPLLFRETGVVVGLVMLAMMMQAAREKWWRVGLGAAALMLGVVLAVMLSPIALGRPSMWKANILAGGDPKVLYADAYAVDELPHGIGNWAWALGRNGFDNLRNLLWTTEDADGFKEESAVWFLLSGIPLGAWLWWRKRDALAGGVSAAVAVLFLADVSCYDIWGYRGTRALLIMLPFVGMLWGAALTRLQQRAGIRAAIVALFFAVGVAVAAMTVRAQAEVNAAALENQKFLESIEPEEQQVLASPFDISLGYVNEHFPIRWAFLPSNCRTMRLLDERYAIGTVVLPVKGASAEMLAGCGLELRVAGERELHGVRYQVLRRGE